MKSMSEEILNLTNLWCENQLDDSQLARLQDLLRASAEDRSSFLALVQLHGQLSWDAGHFHSQPIDTFEGSMDDDSDLAADVTELPIAQRSFAQRQSLGIQSRPGSGFRRIVQRSAMSLAAIAFVFAGIYQYWKSPSETIVVIQPAVSVQNPEDGLDDSNNIELVSDQPFRPLNLNAIAGTSRDKASNSDNLNGPSIAVVPAVRVAMSDDAIIAEIDRLIEVSWQENNVVPAATANGSEWVRRAYLTIAGRIPDLKETSAFLAKPDPRVFDSTVEQLLQDPGTAEYLAVMWTNLLIGRANSRGVDQQALYSFLRDEFAGNRPWIDTVGSLVAANGRSDTNGATNFLLAHLNDQATPATAVTARLFLGQQVHCTQCHDHPFAKDRRQEQFWTLNAFFKQAERKVVEEVDAAGKKREVWTLADDGDAGMTFFDTLRGQKKAVLPEFAGETLPSAQVTSRRSELARLLKTDDEHWVARAMVNRMWAHFFGYGFTNPIDDLGPHNPVSHPELFDHLTASFVNSNYDLRRLMSWMARAEVFRLSSIQPEDGLVVDDPQEGGVPLFSRAYARPMAPEQVYDSIRIAIRSVADQPLDSSVGTEHRRQWVEQFVRAYGTDENDEQLEFEGNIAQALLMMNGQDLQEAIPLAAEEVARTSGVGNSAVSETLRRLALGTLSREPTKREERIFQNRYRSLAHSRPQTEAMKTATEDMLWAYLNSSEFSSVH